MSKSEKAINDCIAKRPTSAVRLQVVDKSIARNDAICSFSVDEVEATGLVEIVRDINAQCEQRADYNNRETPFSIEWLSGDDHVARSVAIRVATSDAAGSSPSDGSIESILSNLQKMLAESHRYTVDLTKLVGGVMEGTIKALMERIEVLEAERASTLQLKEELIVEAASMESDQKANMDRLVGVLEKVVVARLSGKNSPSE
jgi:uncharacterized protein (UPF0335 family)